MNIKSITTTVYFLDLVHIAILVVPFLVLRIPTDVLNLTIGGVIALGLTYLKGLVSA